MTEKVGGIEYAIDADVSGITTAGNAVQASTKRMEDSFSGVDTAVRKMQREISSAGKTITKSGNVVDSFGMINKKATEALKALTAESARLRAEHDALSKSAKGSGKALGGLGRNAGMAGIQVQQFAGQIQGGQSALLALSQQGADLGFVLGAPLVGAVIGIGATLVSFLIPALSGTSIETEGLIEKLEELREKGDLTKIQARALADSRQKDVDGIGKQNKAITEQIILLQKKQERMKSEDTGQYGIPISA
ncbi:MAG: hypothetical protein V2J13_01035, partial [Cycloclasticus sp.]|nr:hypothetical protein [Cycloclasticus sp.]